MDEKFFIDLECKKIIESKIIISETYEEIIKNLLDSFYNLKQSDELFIKNLCLNDVNKNKVIDYLSIFKYVSDLYIRDL